MACLALRWATACLAGVGMPRMGGCAGARAAAHHDAVRPARPCQTTSFIDSVSADRQLALLTIEAGILLGPLSVHPMEHGHDDAAADDAVLPFGWPRPEQVQV